MVHTCPDCGKTTANSSHMEEHRLRYHLRSGELLPFPCDTCDGRFAAASELKNHRKNCPKPIKEFNCALFPECGTTFGWLKAAKAHYRRVHDRNLPDDEAFSKIDDESLNQSDDLNSFDSESEFESQTGGGSKQTADRKSDDVIEDLLDEGEEQIPFGCPTCFQRFALLTLSLILSP